MTEVTLHLTSVELFKCWQFKIEILISSATLLFIFMSEPSQRSKSYVTFEEQKKWWTITRAIEFKSKWRWKRALEAFDSTPFSLQCMFLANWTAYVFVFMSLACWFHRFFLPLSIGIFEYIFCVRIHKHTQTNKFIWYFPE